MTMYKLKPIIDSSVKIDVSKCMYKMKNIHDTNESINHVQTVSSVLNITEQSNPIIPQMAALEVRQEKILQQLENLKKQMQNLRSELQVCSKPNQQIGKIDQKPINVSGLETISIKVHPNYVPYFLLTFTKLWQNRVRLMINFYTHSSVKRLPKSAQTFSEMIQQQEINNPNLPTLNISLIWKEVKNHIEMIVTSTRAPIIGETNIIRYLARIDPNTFNYDQSNDFIRILCIDSILDACYRLSQSTTKTERQTLLRSINSKLGKSQWLAGTEYLSVADIATFSVLNQLEMIKELNVGMTKWVERYQIAVK